MSSSHKTSKDEESKDASLHQSTVSFNTKISTSKSKSEITFRSEASKKYDLDVRHVVGVLKEVQSILTTETYEILNANQGSSNITKALSRLYGKKNDITSAPTISRMQQEGSKSSCNIKKKKTASVVSASKPSLNSKLQNGGGTSGNRSFGALFVSKKIKEARASPHSNSSSQPELNHAKLKNKGSSSILGHGHGHGHGHGKGHGGDPGQGHGHGRVFGIHRGDSRDHGHRKSRSNRKGQVHGIGQDHEKGQDHGRSQAHKKGKGHAHAVHGTDTDKFLKSLKSHKYWNVPQQEFKAENDNSFNADPFSFREPHKSALKGQHSHSDRALESGSQREIPPSNTSFNNSKQQFHINHARFHRAHSAGHLENGQVNTKSNYLLRGSVSAPSFRRGHRSSSIRNKRDLERMERERDSHAAMHLGRHRGGRKKDRIISRKEEEGILQELSLHLQQEYLAMRTHFSFEEVASLQRMFRKLATISEKPNAMDQRLFREFIRNTFNITNNIMLDQMFTYFDAENDGIITETEWIRQLSVVLRGTMEEQIDYCYEIYDINGDGGIERTEIQVLVNDCMDGFTSTSQMAEDKDQQRDIYESVREVADTVFKILDVSKTGAITLTDFRIAVHKDPLCLQCLGQCIPEIDKKMAFFTLLTEHFLNFPNNYSFKWNVGYKHESKKYHLMSYKAHQAILAAKHLHEPPKKVKATSKWNIVKRAFLASASFKEKAAGKADELKREDDKLRLQRLMQLRLQGDEPTSTIQFGDRDTKNQSQNDGDDNQKSRKSTKSTISDNDNGSDTSSKSNGPSSKHSVKLQLMGRRSYGWLQDENEISSGFNSPTMVPGSAHQSQVGSRKTTR